MYQSSGMLLLFNTGKNKMGKKYLQKRLRKKEERFQQKQKADSLSSTEFAAPMTWLHTLLQLQKSWGESAKGHASLRRYLLTTSSHK